MQTMSQAVTPTRITLAFQASLLASEPKPKLTARARKLLREWEQARRRRANRSVRLAERRALRSTLIDIS